MASNSKNFFDISYSIKLGPSTYNVSAHRMNHSKSISPYLPSINTTTRCRSANILSKSSPVQSAKSPTPLFLPEHRPKTSRHSKITTYADFTTRQQKKCNQIYHYTQFQPKQTMGSKIKNERKALTDSIFHHVNKEKTISSKFIQNKRKRFETERKTDPNEEIIQLLNEQTNSLVNLFEQHIHSMKTSSVDLIKQLIMETLKSQQQSSIKELKQTLIETIEKELPKILSNHNNTTCHLNSLNSSTVTQLQDILLQTVERVLVSSNTDNINTLNNLFAEQKQILVDTLTEHQQRTISPVDLIKQALIDALTEYNSLSMTTNSTTNVTNTRQINLEIEINVDLNQTRSDAAFRQQRDTIVANRYLRDCVRQWSNVRSIVSLIKRIQQCGTNDFENAWLTFCWITQNIRYDLNCQKNSIEDVFQHRHASSIGFVNLYHECCSLLNIQSLQISGYIKQCEENVQLCPHVWNAIKIDQYMYLIDSAWGAGGGDNTNEFQDYYFLISPEEFIYTHYTKTYQLLQPKLTKHQFLSLPIVKSNYYRLNLNLLTPKQAFNQTNENLFHVSIKTPAYVDLDTSLQINNIEYPTHLHTLCQRDINQTDIINCFFAPPANGLYDIVIYAKTNDEIKYQETIFMRLNVSNMSPAMTFPIRSQSFHEYKCVLIEPFRRLVQENERLFIHMKIPDAYMIKIKNGKEFLIPNKDEYRNGLLHKEICVHGDIQICARWTEKTDKFSTICIFNMI